MQGNGTCLSGLAMTLLVAKTLQLLMGENERFRGKSHRSDTFSTINPTWSVPGLSPGHGGEKPATNYLSHGMASMK